METDIAKADDLKDRETVEAVKADPEKYRAISMEAQRRAMYANLRALLSRVRDEEDPTVGFFAVSIRASHTTDMHQGGCIRTLEFAGLLDWAKRFLFDQAAARMAGDDAGAGRGDQVRVREGKADIVCGETDKTEADREKAENGLLLAREALEIACEFYGDSIPTHILDSIDLIRAELRTLEPANFYADKQGEAQ